MSTEAKRQGIRLTPYERECLIERAAIMEFDGGMTREDAERAAWEDFDRKKHNALLHGFNNAA